MGKLTRVQKKGKKSSYTCRFLKKRFKIDVYSFDISKPFEVVKFLKMPKTKAVIMRLAFEEERYNLVAPYGIRKGDQLNRDFFIKKLKDIDQGEKVCNIELKPNSLKFMSRAPGTYARVKALEGKGIRLMIKERALVLNPDCRAMIGEINNGDFWLKPLIKAGTASKIQRARGKKYPKVSSSKMNVQESKIGGSNRKRIGSSLCINRNAPPGKCGNYHPKRTGRKKK